MPLEIKMRKFFFPDFYIYFFIKKKMFAEMFELQKIHHIEEEAVVIGVKQKEVVEGVEVDHH